MDYWNKEGKYTSLLNKAWDEFVPNEGEAKTVKIADMLANLADDPTEKQIKKYALGLVYLLDASF